MSTPPSSSIDVADTVAVKQSTDNVSTSPLKAAVSPGHLTSRRGSTASVASTTSTSIGGSLDPAPRRDDTLYESNQTSIARILQPSIVRPGLLPHTQSTAAVSSFRAPTTRDIPPVTLTNIPHVPDSYFHEYLERIEPLFEQYRSLTGRYDVESSQTTKEGHTGRSVRHSNERGDHVSPAISRSSSFSSPVTPDTAPRATRRSSGQIRHHRNEPTPLSVVPSVYFDQDFHLENPRIFDVVSENAEIVRTLSAVPIIEVSSSSEEYVPQRKTLATNAILQEKLSWYMDTVEVHLINNIDAASTGFFSALDSLKELQEEATQSVLKIQGLRRDLKKLDEEVVMGGLALATKTRRAANIRALGKATAQVDRIVEHVQKADEAVNDGRLDDATNEMERVAYSICGLTDAGERHEDGLDLRGLQVLRDMRPDLRGLQYRIGAEFAHRFTSLLMQDVSTHVDRVPHVDTLRRWLRQKGVQPAFMEADPKLRTDLLSTLTNLQRVCHVSTATAAYQECITKEMKNLIRRYLPSSTDDDAESIVSTSTAGGRQLNQQQKSSILARNLRALDAKDAEDLLKNVYTSISEALRRVSTQTKILLDVASSVESRMSFANDFLHDSSVVDPLSTYLSQKEQSSQQETFKVLEELTQSLDIASFLGQAVDTAQGQIIRVLKVRSEQTTHLPRERFLRYFHLNRMFADECEAISGRGGQAIRKLITAQILSFVQAFGSSETEKTSSLLDKDEWNAVNFEASDNFVLQRILFSMSADPPTWSIAGADMWFRIDDRTADVVNEQNSEDGNSVNTSKSTTAPAYIEHTRFVLVASAVSLIRTIEDVLSLTANVPALTLAIANSLLEVLRTFNSRSCQLILGAGAMRSAGLKNITTKHLALSSQALSFVTTLIPYIRECIRRHLPAGQVAILAEFDKTKRLYQEHQSGIHDKLVEIMLGRCQLNVKAMRGIDFDNIRDEDGRPSTYMDTLTKETLTLHRVLARHLGEVDLSMIIRQISSGYKEQLSAAFEEVPISTQQGREKLLRDAEYLASRLGKTPGFTEVSQEIVELVKKKIGGRAQPNSSFDDHVTNDQGINGAKARNEQTLKSEAAVDNGLVSASQSDSLPSRTETPTKAVADQ